MSLKAGHCTTCQAPIWQTCAHPRTGDTIRLYPLPSSVYARVQFAGRSGSSPGVGFCATHAPTVGDAGPVIGGVPTTVVGLARAGERYREWYSPRYMATRRLWLTDHLQMPVEDQARVMAEWETAREEALRDG